MSVVSINREDGRAWVIVNNPPVNAASAAVRQGLLDAVREVRDEPLAILKCAGRTFIAGGDMREFVRAPVEPHLPEVVDAIEASGTPFLALLHGNVLGGGLEIAMACAFRIASPGTRFGLPEVNLGLVPGAGGTQRAPRLFGWEAAAEMACSGRLVPVSEAFALGAVDSIENDLDAAARRFSGPRPVPVSARPLEPRSARWFSERREKLAERARGQQSPLHNLEALGWATLPYASGQKRERALHLKLRNSDESRALRHVFFAERESAKPDAAAGGADRGVERVAVIGGGLMGSGIAAACLGAGCRVKIVERSEDAAAAARERVAGLLQGRLKRGGIDRESLESQSAALSVGSRIDAASDADLVIEAVFEDTDAKRRVFRSLAASAKPDAILATNTSYLDPRDIFDGLPGPGRCVGLHFFSPAHVMRLVEVVQLPGTEADTLATAIAFVRRIRKFAVLSGVCVGFIGNRILGAYRRAAEYMLMDGAMPHEIDAAMRAFGMAMGPFEAQDMAGHQIAEANRRRQRTVRDPQQRPVEISERLCALGRYGQRSGGGWYRYATGDRTPERDPEVETLITSCSREAGVERRNFRETEIQDQLLAVMANEGGRIVEEGIAPGDAAVDVVKVLGYGFPRWRGGPMHAAESAGCARIRRALDALDAASPGSWRRAARFA